MTVKKSFKMIVYIGEFDKYDTHGNLLCRNTMCRNPPKSPYRKYCSKKCNKDFRCWYYHNFYWERIRSDIFKRDNYTCQICKRTYPYTYRRKFARSKNLECDHIVPRSLYRQLGYKYDTIENKVKVTLDFFHNHKNLRTLCHDCHRNVTSKYLSGKFKVITNTGQMSTDTNPQQLTTSVKINPRVKTVKKVITIGKQSCLDC